MFRIYYQLIIQSIIIKKIYNERVWCVKRYKLIKIETIVTMAFLMKTVDKQTNEYCLNSSFESHRKISIKFKFFLHIHNVFFHKPIIFV